MASMSASPEIVETSGFAVSARLRGLVVPVAAWIGVSVMFAAVQSTTELDPDKPAAFLLFANAAHFGLWALTLPTLRALVSRFPIQRGRAIRHILVFFPACFCIAFVVSIAYLSLVFFTWFPLRAHFPTYGSVLRRGVDLFVQMDLLACVFLVASLHAWRWFSAYRAEQVRSAELESRLAAAELGALRMQLQPHFLFNTLHSIAGLVSEDPPAARRMIIALGDFLRLTLEDHAVPMRSLGEELEFLRLYVAIEQMRLGNRLTVEYVIAPETFDAKLPYLLLQPLMENAIRHGAARISRPATIRLSAERSSGDLHLSLENDGPTSTRAVKHGIGISNTLARLRLHYGEAFQFSLMDRPQGGCVASLTVPYDACAARGSQNGLSLEPDMSRSHC